MSKHITYTKSLSTSVSIGFTTLDDVLNRCEICLNTSNNPIVNNIVMIAQYGNIVMIVQYGNKIYIYLCTLLCVYILLLLSCFGCSQ